MSVTWDIYTRPKGSGCNDFAIKFFEELEFKYPAIGAMLLNIAIKYLCDGCPATHIENLIHRNIYGYDLFPEYDFWDCGYSAFISWILNLFWFQDRFFCFGEVYVYKKWYIREFWNSRDTSTSSPYVDIYRRTAQYDSLFTSLVLSHCWNYVLQGMAIRSIDTIH